MATVTIRRAGFSAGLAGPGRAPGETRKARGEIVGWSMGAARRNVAFLQSVDPEGLPPHGYALTLTMGGWPDSADAWNSARRAFLKRADRLGFPLQHWVVESTRLGRPHLHLALYGEQSRADARWLLVLAWLRVCDSRGWTAQVRAQTVEPITRLNGWLQYVARHGARGVDHYQRAGLPAGWEKTGRLWGHSSGWPTPEPLVYDLTEAEFHRFRRLAVSVVRARLRAAGLSTTKVQRVASSMRHPDPAVSTRVGVGYWIDRDLCDSLVTLSRGREPVLRYDSPYDT